MKGENMLLYEYPPKVDKRTAQLLEFSAAGERKKVRKNATKSIVIGLIIVLIGVLIDNIPVKIHLQINTGLNRYGFRTITEYKKAINKSPSGAMPTWNAGPIGTTDHLDIFSTTVVNTPYSNNCAVRDASTAAPVGDTLYALRFSDQSSDVASCSENKMGNVVCTLSCSGSSTLSKIECFSAFINLP